MTQSAQQTPHAELSEAFLADREQWYRNVAGVFARVQRKDVADIPLDIYTKLITTTEDELTINPLYTAADELAEAAAPGEFPFVRGTAVRPGWDVAERFGYRGQTPAEVNATLLEAMANGTTLPVITLGNGVEPADLGTVLENVYLNLAPVAVESGTALAEVVQVLAELAHSNKHGEGEATVDLLSAPLTAGLSDSPTVSLDDAVTAAAAAAGCPDAIRTFVADGAAIHNQGGSDVEEVAYALSVALAYVKAMEAAGLTREQALGQIAFRFSATDVQFNTIAKFRAARELWARVAELLGHPELGAAPQHAETSLPMMTQRDPWVNMLRCTIAAFAAGVGGASSVLVHRFDAAINGGLDNVSHGFVERIARNTGLLLLEESHTGHVVDPGGGSFFIESLTDETAEAAWALFQQIEGRGGFTTDLESGELAKVLEETHAARLTRIAHRKQSVTGVNEFPNILEAPLPVDKRDLPGIKRYAAEFEALRNRADDYVAAQGSRPQVALIPLGPLSKHNGRSTFAANLFASGGIAVANPGEVDPAAEDFAATVTAEASQVACIVGTDDQYAINGLAAVEAARKAGFAKVFVAGGPKVFADAQGDQAVDGILGLTIDAVSTLSDLLTEFGA